MSDRTDTDRLQFLLDALHWDGHGYWLPDWCVRERDSFSGETYTKPPSLDEFRAELDRISKRNA